MAYTRMVGGRIDSVLEVSDVRCEDSDPGPRGVADRESGFGRIERDSGVSTLFPSLWSKLSLRVARFVPTRLPTMRCANIESALSSPPRALAILQISIRRF